MGQSRVEHQKIKEIKGREPPGDSSSYWEFQNKGGEREDPRANPDLLSYSESNMLWPTKQTKLTELETDVIEELYGFNYATILNPKEQKIISLFVNAKLSIKEIAKAEGLSKQRVGDVIKTIGDKIRNHLKLEE